MLLRSQSCYRHGVKIFENIISILSTEMKIKIKLKTHTIFINCSAWSHLLLKNTPKFSSKNGLRVSIIFPIVVQDLISGIGTCEQCAHVHHPPVLLLLEPPLLQVPNPMVMEIRIPKAYHRTKYIQH